MRYCVMLNVKVYSNMGGDRSYATMEARMRCLDDKCKKTISNRVRGPWGIS